MDKTKINSIFTRNLDLDISRQNWVTAFLKEMGIYRISLTTAVFYEVRRHFRSKDLNKSNIAIFSFLI